MKKSELKNIIKECVKEVIFEEGVLSGIISEVATGLGARKVVETTTISESSTPQRTHASREVLSSVGKNAYEKIKNNFKNPELFEGTKPIPKGNGRGALSGISPDDPGVDLNSIPGMGSWAALAKGSKQ
ncbi:MAG TPA: hypothetical protein DF712_19925 [Balneola sp.]|nr:hypothetical protein [Balneola sp.]